MAKTLMVRSVPDELYKALKYHCADTDKKMNEVVIEALTRFLYKEVYHVKETTD